MSDLIEYEKVSVMPNPPRIWATPEDIEKVSGFWKPTGQQDIHATHLENDISNSRTDTIYDQEAVKELIESIESLNGFDRFSPSVLNIVNSAKRCKEPKKKLLTNQYDPKDVESLISAAQMYQDCAVIEEWTGGDINAVDNAIAKLKGIKKLDA